MAIYPKIRGIPEEKRKKQELERGRENDKANRQALLTKETLKKFTEDKEREEYNKELKRLITLEREKEHQRA